MKQNMILTDEDKAARRELRLTATHTGLGALLYTVVIAVISMIGLVPLMINYIVSNLNTMDYSELMSSTMDFLMNHPATGILSLVSAILGLAAVFLCFLKQRTHKEIFRKNKSMSLKKFGALLCILYLFSFVGDACYRLIEQDLNVFGLSTSLGLEIASGSQSTLSMFLYAGLIGPIIEELIFRGFLLRRMEKHGKLLAILVTSVLFGLMHQNLPQVLCASMIGFVLGYIAMEYSIIWSIILHIFNNLIMCDFLGRLLEGASETVQFLVYRGFDLVTGIIAVVVIIRNRKGILSWIRNNLSDKPVLTWAFSSVGLVLTLAYFVTNTILSIGML